MAPSSGVTLVVDNPGPELLDPRSVDPPYQENAYENDQKHRQKQTLERGDIVFALGPVSAGQRGIRFRKNVSEQLVTSTRRQRWPNADQLS